MLRYRDRTAAASVFWSVESPVPGVVLVDVAVDSFRSDTPLHWRAGDWSKPPLDVSLSADGRFESLQFVLQDEHVPLASSLSGRSVTAGLPTFDVSDWPLDGYRDERLQVQARRTERGKLLLSIGDQRDDVDVRLGVSGLVLAFAERDLVAVTIGPLDKHDWAAIDAFSGGH